VAPRAIKAPSESDSTSTTHLFVSSVLTLQLVSQTSKRGTTNITTSFRRSLFLWFVQMILPFQCFHRQAWGGRGGSLVIRRISSEESLVRIPPWPPHVSVTLGKSFTRSCLWRFRVKLRHSIRSVSGGPLSSNGLEEAL